MDGCTNWLHRWRCINRALDYPDIEVCTGANGSVANFTPLSCDLPTQVDNGDGTLTFVSITYFSPDMATGSALGVLLNSVSLDACAFELGFPGN